MRTQIVQKLHELAISLTLTESLALKSRVADIYFGQSLSRSQEFPQSLSLPPLLLIPLLSLRPLLQLTPKESF